MSMPSAVKNKRILRELHEMQTTPPDNITANLIDKNDLNRWVATIKGPTDTAYTGIIYEILLLLPPNYPFSPPTCKFVNKILHPNIKDGEVCLDILKTTWSPALSISSLLLSISSLLGNPNLSSPFDMDAAELLKNDKEKFKRAVAEIAREKYSKN